MTRPAPAYALQRGWRAVDRYLLLHHPVLWTLRAHVTVVTLLAGFVLVSTLAVLHPLSTNDVLDVADHQGPVYAIAVAIAAAWLILVLRARNRLPLMIRWEGWSVPLYFGAVVLLYVLLGAAYMGIFSYRIAHLVSPLVFEQDTVAIQAISRPEPLGEISAEQTDELSAALARYNGFDADDTQRVVLVMSAIERLNHAIDATWLSHRVVVPVIRGETRYDSTLAAPPPLLEFGAPWDSVLSAADWLRECFAVPAGETRSRCGGAIFDLDRIAGTVAHQRLAIALYFDSIPQQLERALVTNAVDTTQTRTRDFISKYRALAQPSLLDPLPFAAHAVYDSALTNLRQIAWHKQDLRLGLSGDEWALLFFPPLIAYLAHMATLAWRLPSVRQLLLGLPALVLVVAIPFAVDTWRLQHTRFFFFVLVIYLAYGGAAFIATRWRRLTSFSTVNLAVWIAATPMILALGALAVGTEMPSNPIDYDHRMLTRWSLSQRTLVAVALYLMSLPLLQAAMNHLRAARR